MTNNNLREKIILLLIEDARLSYRQIAKKLEVSPTTVSKFIAELEEDGVVQGYTTLIDWHRLGYDSTICLQLRVSPKANIDKVGKELKALGPIKQVFYTTGEKTFSAFAVCKDNDEATETLGRIRKIPGVEQVVPHTVLKTY